MFCRSFSGTAAFFPSWNIDAAHFLLPVSVSPNSTIFSGLYLFFSSLFVSNKVASRAFGAVSKGVYTLRLSFMFQSCDQAAELMSNPPVREVSFRLFVWQSIEVDSLWCNFCQSAVPQAGLVVLWNISDRLPESAWSGLNNKKRACKLSCFNWKLKDKRDTSIEVLVPYFHCLC